MNIFSTNNAVQQALGGLLLALVLPSWLPIPEPPEWVERWLYNAEERTTAGLEALGEGDPETAARRFDSAAQLSPDDPLTQLNSGTGRLLADKAGEAIEPLERAVDIANDLGAEGTTMPWAVDAHYNLGTAQLADGDPAAAVESLKQALRLDPSHRDAKHNLELALRQLDDQPPSAQEPDPSSESENEDEDGDQDEEGSEDSSGDSGEEDENQEPSESESSEGEQQPEERQDGEGRSEDLPENPGEQSATSRNRTLENFEQQPEMTAEQAAALLDAVDNLERQQRHEQAEAEARAPKGEDKDW